MTRIFTMNVQYSMRNYTALVCLRPGNDCLMFSIRYLAAEEEELDALPGGQFTLPLTNGTYGQASLDGTTPSGLLRYTSEAVVQYLQQHLPACS